MVECRYCTQTFEEESAIREHLYEVHERDELSRIDRQRVKQYVDEHRVDESSNEADQEASEQRTADTSNGVSPAGAWELSDVQALSTDEIVEKLSDHGIDTSETAFRNRISDCNAATTLSEQWEAEHEVAATGYDQDFIWMAAQVLWERWAPDVPNKERIYDFVQEGRDLRETGNQAAACDRWLTAWEYIVAVTPDESTTIDEANRKLPSFLSLAAFIRSLDSDLATVAEADPAYHEQRLKFCREVCEEFPDASDEFRLDFRHFVADSLAELDRTADSRAEFESLIEEYPEDPWAYKKLADSYWLDDLDQRTREEIERTAELYQAALDADGPLEGASIVADRLDAVENRLAETETSNEREA